MSWASTSLTPLDVLKTTPSFTRRSVTLQTTRCSTSNGKKANLIFLESNERLNTVTYCKYLEESVFPWARAMYRDHWWWQQDGASVHTAKCMQQFLEEQTLGFPSLGS